MDTSGTGSSKGYKTLDEIKGAVDAADGILTMRMLELRDAHGAGRLGIHVRSNISKALLGLGIGHLPADLPDWQEDAVRLYRLGTPVADVIDAVLNPSQTHDEELRQVVGGGDAAVLAKVRELVCK